MHIASLESRWLFASFGLDDSFGTHGRLTVDLNAGGMVVRDAIPVDGDGAILLLGPQGVVSGPATSGKLVRVSSEGLLYTGFDQDGILDLTNSPKNIIARRDSDGAFVTVNFDNHTLRWFNANGTLNTGFSGDGFLPLNFNSQPLTVERAIFASNGDLIVVGSALDSGDNIAWLLLRIKQDGNYRTSYGNNGIVRLGTNSNTFDHTPFMVSETHDVTTAHQIVESNEGVVYVAGTRLLTVDDEGEQTVSETEIRVIRVLAEGVVDRRTLDFEGATLMRRTATFSSYVMAAQSIGGQGIELQVSEAGRLVRERYKLTGRYFHRVSDSVSYVADKNAMRLNDGSIVVWTDYADQFESAHLLNDLSIDYDWGLGRRTSARVKNGKSVSNGEKLVHYGYDGDNHLIINQFDGSPARSIASAGSSAVSTDHALVVRGTAGDDIVRVLALKKRAIGVYLNGNNIATYAYDKTLELLIVDGDNGNDRIDVSRTYLPLGTISLGGKGDDTIIGSPRYDFIYSGDGNDVISGGIANDFIEGGLGDDRIDGGADQDDIQGNNGRDTLNGGEGYDHVDGGYGSDRIAGGAGEDNLYGDNGRDFIDGGDDTDYLYGGDSLDTLIGGNGTDYYDPLDTGESLITVEAVITDD